MPSIYDNLTAINSQYVPKFIGSNIEQISQAAKTLDDRFRANKDYSDKVAMTLAQEQYLDNDKHLKDSLAQNIYGQIDKISKSDANFENSSAAVSQVARDFFTNQHRIAALDNFKRVEQAKTMRNELGKDALNFGDNPDTFSTVDPETGAPRKFNNAIEKRGDYSGRMQQLLGKVAEDGYYVKPTGEKVTIDGVDRYLLKSGQIEKLTKTKLDDLIEGLLPSYKASGEGQQDIKRLQHLEGVPNDPVTIKTANGLRETNMVDENIRQRFKAVAYPQSYAKSFGKFDDFGLPKGGDPNNPNPSGSYSGTIPGGVTTNDSLKPLRSAAAEYTFTEDGKSYQYIDKTTGKPIPNSSNPYHIDGPSNIDANYVDDFNANAQKVEVSKAEAVDAEHVENFNRLKVELGDVIEKQYGSFDNYKTKYNEAVEHSANITPSGVLIQPGQKEQYKDLINGTVAVSPIYFKDAPAKGLKEFADQLGVSPESIEFEPIATHYDSPKQDIPGGYIEAKVKSTSKDKPLPKNAPTTVFLPVNDQFVQLSKPIDEVLKNSLYKGTDTYTSENPYSTGIMAYDTNGVPTSELMVYTATYPKLDGSGFETAVFEGDKTYNGSGGYTVEFHKKPVKSSVWRNQMISRLQPEFNKVLNSGQSAGVEDFKKRGIDF